MKNLTFLSDISFKPKGDISCARSFGSVSKIDKNDFCSLDKEKNDVDKSQKNFVFYKDETLIKPFIRHYDIDCINTYLRSDSSLPEDLQKKFNYLMSISSLEKEESLIFRGVDNKFFDKCGVCDVITPDKGFQFCSKSMDEAIDYGQKTNKSMALLHITCPMGTRVFQGKKIDFPSYVLLKPNQSFVVTNKETDKNGIVHVFLTCIN